MYARENNENQLFFCQSLDSISLNKQTETWPFIIEQSKSTTTNEFRPDWRTVVNPRIIMEIWSLRFDRAIILWTPEKYVLQESYFE